MKRSIIKTNISTCGEYLSCEVFGSLKGFKKKYPEYWRKKQHSIIRYITRLKIQYKSKTGSFILERKIVY